MQKISLQKYLPHKLAALAILACSSSAYTEVIAADMKSNSKSPVNIESDSLVYESKQGSATFTGHVIVTQDDMKITADKMKVFSDPVKGDIKSDETAGEKADGEPAKQQMNTNFKRIEAYGNVDFAGKDIIGKSDEGIYEVDKEILTLKGNVYINQKGNELYGERFVYNTKTSMYNVYNSKNATGSGVSGGDGKRVKLVIMPDKAKTLKLKGEKEIKKTPID